MNKLESKPIKILLLNLIIPSFVTALVSGSYNLIDGIFIGQTLGIKGNSANAYTFMIYALVYSFSALASEGTASLLTIALGENNYLRANKILDVSVFVSIFMAVFQAIFLWFGLKYILLLFGTPLTFYNYVKSFCLVFFLGSPIYFVAHTLIYCIRAQGNVQKVLIINIASFLANVAMGSFLIMELRLGFVGSALATVFANLVTLIFTIYEYRRKSSQIRLNFKNFFKIDKNLIYKILNMGLPFFLTTLISVFLLTLYNRIAFAYAGTIGLATLSIVSSIYRYIISLMNSITDGVQPVISYNYGAKKLNRVQRGLNFSLLIGTFFSLLLFIIIQLWSKQITSLFNSQNQNFVQYASHALQIVMISLPLQGVINIGTSYFQYISLAKESTILVILRQIIFQIPLAILLPLKYTISGLWSSYYLSDILIFFVILILLVMQRKRLTLK